MLHRNARGDKNPGSTNKCTKFCQLIIRKIIKIIVTRSHILRLKCTKFYSRRLSIRPSVCPFVRPSVCLWHGRRVAATSTRRDGGDRGGGCWCTEAVRVSLSVRPSLRWSLTLRVHCSMTWRDISALYEILQVVWDIFNKKARFNI